MDKNPVLFKRTLVIVILVLLVGMSINPSTGTIIKKTSSATPVSRGYIQDLIDNASDESYVKEKIESIVFSEPNVQEGDQYITLNVKEATSCLMKPGKPILPVYTKIFNFPFGTKIKRVNCKPLQINQKVISEKIQPSPEPVLSIDVNNAVENRFVEDYTFKDITVYNSMDFFPSSWYDYRIGCGLEDSNHVVFLAIRFYPVRYSPGQNIIQFTNTVDIKVEFIEPRQPVVFPDEYDMVVITPTEFSEDLQPLVDYKNDGIIATKLVSLDDIYTGTYFPVQGRDNQEKIKYFIKDAIENWDITYVLLAGGANKVPVRMSYVQDAYEESIISDLYYADIYDQYGQFCSWDSNDNDIFGEYNYQGRTDFVDLYPDVHLGRLNFRSINEVSNVVDKIITYESTGAYMEDWFLDFVAIGGDTFSDSGNVDEGEYLNQKALDIMDDFTPLKIWATSGKLQFAINIDNAINDGAGFVYFSGHGTYENWATHPHNRFDTWWPIGTYYDYRIETLNNGGKLPIVVIGGCSNCQFSEDHCFGWSFVKNPDGGGIASYGNSALGYQYRGAACSQGLSGARELNMFRAYKYQNAETTGEMWSQSITSYINDYGLSSVYDYKTLEEWQPFCDPSLRFVKISTKPNKPDKPDGPTLGGVGLEYTYTTSTTDPDGDLIKYCFDWGDNSFDWTDWISLGKNASLDHKWEKPDEYKIKVKARDQYGLDSEWSEPLIVTIVSEAPFFDIVKIKGGFGKVSATIKNIGSLDAYDVYCNISVTGGIFGFIDVFTEETFETLAVDEEKTMSAGKIFGLGKIDVTVSASSPSANSTAKTVQGFVLGPFVFV